MSTYIIPEEDRIKIHNNSERPNIHEFWYEDSDGFYFNDNVKSYFNFDYDSIFQSELSMTLDEYLSGLEKYTSQWELDYDMNNRKSKVLKLMQWVKTNPLVDTTKAFDFFVHISSKTDLYKYTWDLDQIENWIANEMSTDEHWFKAFLEWYVDEEQTKQVHQVILSTLQ